VLVPINLDDADAGSEPIVDHVPEDFEAFVVAVDDVAGVLRGNAAVLDRHVLVGVELRDVVACTKHFEQLRLGHLDRVVDIGGDVGGAAGVLRAGSLPL
jgi:hypothetical protein